MMWLAVGMAMASPSARYALVAGANDGGADRAMLQFAASDAVSVGTVLTELGGVPSDNLLVLADPSVDTLRSAITSLGTRVAARTEQTSVVVYYSGHSDEHGLLLQGHSYAYTDLRRDLEEIGADVLVAIVDGCASGAMVRAKGSHPIPAFLPSTVAAVEGHAYLTSSSADELSQEADHIGASYFTHALVTGLRGAADFDDDHRVTLREAHQFAADETLARTQRTRLGAQHPSYDIQLSGIGDFVLTDVGAHSSRLLLGKTLRGRTYLRDQEGRLVAELFKRSGRTVELGLPPGKYEAVVDDDGALFEGVIRVDASAPATLEAGDLDAIEGEVTLARGRVYARVPLALTVVPTMTSEGLDARDQLHHVSFGLIAVHAARLRGFSLASVASTTRDGAQGVQLAGVYAHAGGELHGLQGSFGASVAEGEVVGLQVAPVTIAGPLRGVQLGALSYSPANHGLQLSPVNIAGASSGVQIGVFNYAREQRGLSLGAVQVSSTARGVPLAVLPVIRDGMHHAEVFTSTMSPLNVGFKLGSRAVYTQYVAGLDPRGWGQVGLGFGARTRPGPWQVDLDGVATLGVRHGLSFLPTVRASVARPLRGDSLAPFATVSLGLETLLDEDAASALWLPSVEAVGDWRIVPGAAVGFRL